MRRKFYGRRGFALAVTALLVSRAALAVAPPNDTCAGAEIIPTAGPFPYYSEIVDARDATVTDDPWQPSCRSVGVGRSVWYKFTPPTTRLYTISASGDTATTVLDTVMVIYTSQGGCGGPFTEVACNDDQGNCQSAISMTLSVNVTYYIVVWMSSVSPPLRGMTSVQLLVSQPVAPSNDSCQGAEIIPGNGPFPHWTAITDTTLATVAGDPTPSCALEAVRSVWFQFTPQVAATYELSLCTNTATTVYDTVLAIYTSSIGCGGALTEVSCNHTNPCANLPRSTITAVLNAGVTYYIVAWEGVSQPYVPGETSLQLRVARFLPPSPMTLPASSLTSTSAILNAAVNPNGLPTSAWFEWGPTTDYGSATTPISLTDANTNIAVAAVLSALQAGQTYHYRIVAVNGLGITQGLDGILRWSATPPQITSYLNTNGGFLLRFTGQPGQVYIIEASANFTAWTGLGVATDLGAGIFEFRDAQDLPPRLYRVRAP